MDCMQISQQTTAILSLISGKVVENTRHSQNLPLKNCRVVMTTIWKKIILHDMIIKARGAT